ncbi:MAG: DUF871 domain-containing protein [Firmicutes bacterium]|nr:DUF871 domain-containing protein [Bacillota bacterium]
MLGERVIPGVERSAGISVYPGAGDTAQVLGYMERASQLGYREVFTSMHITEQDPSGAVAFVEQVTKAAHRLGFRVIADISPRAFRAVGATPANLEPLERLGLNGIRVDFGYGPDEIASMTHSSSSMTVVVNASTVDVWALSALRSSGADFSRMEACHNFYPRPETGLSMDFLCRTSSILKEHGLRVWAFVPSSTGRRGPLCQGLPTLERHRELPAARAAAELLASGVVDVLLFGDPGASPGELESLSSIWLRGSVPLRVSLLPDAAGAERSVVFGGIHQNRPDPAEMVVRSAVSRDYAGKGADILPRSPAPRPAYTVTVDNRLYLRYSGELQVTLTDLPPDPRVNVVGHVVEADRPLVNMLGPRSRFHFVEFTVTTGGSWNGTRSRF